MSPGPSGAPALKLSEVRRARDVDAPELVRLRSLMMSEVGAPSSGPWTELATAWFSRHLRDPDPALAAFVVDAELLGEPSSELLGEPSTGLLGEPSTELLGEPSTEPLSEQTAAAGGARLAACVMASIVEIAPSPLRPDGRNGYLWNIVTDPHFRRRGLAKLVTASAMEWFAEQGILIVDLHATDGAVELYRGLGFREPPNLALRHRSDLATAPPAGG